METEEIEFMLETLRVLALVLVAVGTFALATVGVVPAGVMEVVVAGAMWDLMKFVMFTLPRFLFQNEGERQPKHKVKWQNFSCRF